MFMKKIFCYIIIILLIFTQLNITTFAEDRDNISRKIQYYTYDEAKEEFVKDEEYRFKSSFAGYDKEPEPITIDGEEYFIKINSIKKDEGASSNHSYTELYRIQSIANGQISSISNEYTKKNVHSTSHITKTNKSFSVDAKVLKEISESKSREVFNLGYQYSKDYSSSNKETTINSIITNQTKKFNIPLESIYDLCNSADFYIFKDYEVYDIEAEIYLKYSTEDKNKGYTKIIRSRAEPGGNAHKNWLQCKECNAILVEWDNSSGPMPKGKLPADESSYYPYCQVPHVEFANGRTRHFSLEEWANVNNKIYFPYNKNGSTKVKFKFYKPMTKAVTLPWNIEYINNNTEIELNKPIELFPKGASETVYHEGRNYLFTVVESPLVDSNYAIDLSTESIASISKGVTEEISCDKNITTITSHSSVVSSSHGFSAGLKLKFASWLTGALNYSQKKTKITENNDEYTDSKNYQWTSTFEMPQGFINAGYDCIMVFLTKDAMRYKVTGEITPINTDGSLDLSKKETIVYYQSVEFPRAISKPLKVLPTSTTRSLEEILLDD
jgi:hypothetical protein